MATFSVHFDGDITKDHHVSIRVLGNTYLKMQSAIDRAYIVQKYGSVHKYERLNREEYQDTEFIALYPREGGIILDAVRETGNRILDGIYTATRRIYGQAVDGAIDQNQSFGQQLAARKDIAARVGMRNQSFNTVRAGNDTEWGDAYSNRSVVKEIDGLVKQINRPDLDSSTVAITISGTRSNLPLDFSQGTAKRFHAIVSQRELGPAMIVNIVIRSLDKGNRTTRPSAKVINLHTGKEVSLNLFDSRDFESLHPYHSLENGIRIYACPVMEAGGFDFQGGDLQFLGVA